MRRNAPSDSEVVYLLHFERPLSDDPKSHPRNHYLGKVDDDDHLEPRLDLHRNGQGARFCAVAAERGISFVVARVWHGPRGLERQLKNRKRARDFCPVCNPKIVIQPDGV